MGVGVGWGWGGGGVGVGWGWGGGGWGGLGEVGGAWLSLVENLGLTNDTWGICLMTEREEIDRMHISRQGPTPIIVLVSTEDLVTAFLLNATSLTINKCVLPVLPSSNVEPWLEAGSFLFRESHRVARPLYHLQPTRCRLLGMRPLEDHCEIRLEGGGLEAEQHLSPQN